METGTNRPLFSMIVPIYNAESYLQECVDSLLNQTFHDYEIVLVDDGSKDQSLEICRDYEKKFARIKVVHQENRGLVSAREAGLEAVSGKYVGYVDADDWVEGNLFEEAAKVIEKYAPDIISYNVLLEYSKRQEKQPLTIEAGYYEKQRMKESVYPFMLYNEKENFYNFGIYPSTSNKFFKKELVQKNRCTDYRITMGEDAACTYACLLEADSLYVMKGYFYHYRQNQGSMTNAYDPQRFRKYQILLEYMGKVLTESNYNIPEQLKAHKAFRVKHAILNESKAPDSFRKKKKNLERKMKKYHFDSAFDELGSVRAGAASKVFIYLVRHKRYGSLLIMCEIFKRLRRY